MEVFHPYLCHFDELYMCYNFNWLVVRFLMIPLVNILSKSDQDWKAVLLPLLSHIGTLIFTVSLLHKVITVYACYFRMVLFFVSITSKIKRCRFYVTILSCTNILEYEHTKNYPLYDIYQFC